MTLSKKILFGLVLLTMVGLVTILRFNGQSAPLQNYGTLPEAELLLTDAKQTKPIALSNLKGKPWIASFLYTTCAGPCPMLAGQLSKLQQELPDDVRLGSFTVDPDNDTAEKLSLYARRFEAQPDRWFFLSSSSATLRSLFRDTFKIAVAENSQAPENSRFIHSTKLVLIDQKGSIRGYYDSDDKISLKKLKQDVKKLLE